MAEQQQSFTPGPWSVNPVHAQVECAGLSRFGGLLPVAQMLWPTDERSEAETEANARLIAAAPELLEPAEDAIEILTVAIDLWNEVYPDEPDEVFTDLQRRFQEVVAKARGKAALASAQAAK